MKSKIPSAKKKQKSIIVGLTGGIGSGKSTVCYILKKYGAQVISCDEIAHRALRKNTKTYTAIIDAFGKKILDRDGQIIRKKLARVIFANKKKKKCLEDIIHPFVFHAIEKVIKNACGYVVIDIPLLFETGFEKRVDYTIVVSASPTEQLTRIMKRDGLTKKEAQRRIGAQMPLSKKRKKADWVIHNHSIQKTIEKTENAWKKIIKK